MVRTRIAPSPTGYLHIGSLHTMLYDYFLARQAGGQFIVRIEDTDRERLVQGALESFLKTMAAFRLDYDEGPVLHADGSLAEKGEYGPYIQSARLAIYQKYADELLKQGHAYPCFCSPERLEEMRNAQQAIKQAPKYDRACLKLSADEVRSRLSKGEPHVLRMKIPDGSSSFTDPIRGMITFDHAEVDDQVLLKSDGFPTYHLAVVVDDHLMQITHVLRGEEWLSSTPKQIILHKMFGWKMPVYAHVPLILNPDKTKLSKRQGDVSAESYLAKGYLPEALTNFLALLGWNPTADREIFSREELIKLFDLSKVNKAGAVMNVEKLQWMNAQYIKKMTEEDYLRVCQEWIPSEYRADGDLWDRGCRIVRDRLKIFSELPELVGFLFKSRLDHDVSVLPWKMQTIQDAAERLHAVRSFLADQDETFFSSPQTIETSVRTWLALQKAGVGESLWPLRVALSNQKQSPGPFELLYAYGKARALERIDEALGKVE